MPQIARLFGDTPALYYLGARLRESGLSVELYRQNTGEIKNEALRPLRLQNKSIRLLKDLLNATSRPHFFLEQAPLLSSWSHAGSFSYEGVFDTHSQLDRWVNSEDLYTQTREIFEQMGGRVHSENVQRLPRGKGTSLLEVMDIDVNALETSLHNAYYPQIEKRPLVLSAELWMPFAKDLLEEPRLEFAKFENTLVLSEKHPKGGRVMTLFTASQYSLQRALKALKDPRGVAPISWKARVLAEGGSLQERYSKHHWGYSGFYRPGVWALGQSVGLLNPVHNLNASDALCQAERLYQRYLSLPRGESLLLAAEDWRRSERQKCFRDLRRSQFTEKLLFSSKWSSLAHRTSQLLPSGLRRVLKSPV